MPTLPPAETAVPPESHEQLQSAPFATDRSARLSAGLEGAERPFEVSVRPERLLKLNWKELWAYRELFYFLAWRDVKVRYKQTAIGAAWAIFQPFVLMVVFTLFFNSLLGVQAPNGIPYAIFAYTGLIFWNFFSNALTYASTSLVGNQALISKTYFPRLIAPFSSTIVSLIDFFFAFWVYAGLMIYYRIVPGLSGVILFLPMLALAFVAASGLGMFFAALNVKYRDVKVVLPFLVQTLFFITPIIFPVSLVPERYQWILYFNPMTGVISTVRAGMLHEGSIHGGLLALSIASALVCFGLALVYFRFEERQFADVI
jgi:lipopolysaccharide transport system permease protein